MTEPAHGAADTTEAWFDSAGTRCAARIYRPASERPAPVVVMAHGFGSVRALRLYAYAERFAAAGYAVVVFDYRGFGESEGQPRQVLDIAMQHGDWRTALRFAKSLDGVDAERVVAWGTSSAARPPFGPPERVLRFGRSYRPSGTSWPRCSVASRCTSAAWDCRARPR